MSTDRDSCFIFARLLASCRSYIKKNTLESQSEYESIKYGSTKYSEAPSAGTNGSAAPSEQLVVRELHSRSSQELELPSANQDVSETIGSAAPSERLFETLRNIWINMSKRFFQQPPPLPELSNPPIIPPLKTMGDVKSWLFYPRFDSQCVAVGAFPLLKKGGCPRGTGG